MTPRTRRLFTPKAASPDYQDGLSIALTFVICPLLFGLVGAFLDKLLGTSPVLMLALGLLGLVAVSVTIYYRYQATSAAQDAGKPWSRRTTS